MGVAAVLRGLWRRKLLLAGAALLSVIVGVVVTHRVPSLESRQYDVGIASATALVDTPRSQVVDIGTDEGVDAGALPARAALLASLMANSPVREAIAVSAGIAPGKLIVFPPATEGNAAPAASLTTTGAPVSLTDPAASILRTSVPNLPSGQLPVIIVETQAPTAAMAAKLADRAVLVLRRHVRDVAGGEKVPDARRLVLRPLGRAQSATENRGPTLLIGIMAALGTFALACIAILAVAGLVRSWRLVAAAESAPANAKRGGDDESGGSAEGTYADVAFLQNPNPDDGEPGKEPEIRPLRDAGAA